MSRYRPGYDWLLPGNWLTGAPVKNLYDQAVKDHKWRIAVNDLEKDFPRDGSKRDPNANKRLKGIIAKEQQNKKGGPREIPISLKTDTQENKLTNALTKDNGVAGREWNASFSPREERALNQVRGSVAQNRARLKRDFGTPTQEIPQTPAQENKNPDFDTKTPTDPDNKNQWTPPPEMWNPDNPANKNVPDFGEAVEANKEGGLAQSGGQAGPTPKAMMAMAAKIFGQKGQKAPEQQVAHNPLDWDLDWQSSYSQGYW